MLAADVDGFIGPIFADVAVLDIHREHVVAHESDRRKDAHGGDFFYGIFAVVTQKARDEFFLHSLNDIGFAGSFDEEEHGEFPIDLADMTFENDLRVNGTNGGFSFDILEQLFVGDADPELDDIQVAALELARTGCGKVQVGVVGENARLFESEPFSSNGTYIDTGGLAHSVVALTGVTDEMSDNQTFLLVKFSHV